MRRLTSRHETEKNRKRNQFIMGVALVVVMVISVLGFGFQGGGSDSGLEKVTYNGYEFVNQNGVWVIGDFAFKNNPEQVPNIGFVLKTITDYQGIPLYIYSKYQGAGLEISANMEQVAQRIQKACIENEECAGDFPVKTCSDNFIIIKEDINNSITQEDNCIYITGPKEELVKLVDQFLFKILGIRP